jgi:hypothetical protein
MPYLKTSRQSLASTKWWDPACRIESSAKCGDAMVSLTSIVARDNSIERSHPRGVMGMPLSSAQEKVCERSEKGEPAPRAAALIGQQAQELILQAALLGTAGLVSKGSAQRVQGAADYPRGMETSRGLNGRARPSLIGAIAGTSSNPASSMEAARGGVRQLVEKHGSGRRTIIGTRSSRKAIEPWCFPVNFSRRRPSRPLFVVVPLRTEQYRVQPPLRQQPLA